MENPHHGVTSPTIMALFKESPRHERNTVLHPDVPQHIRYPPGGDIVSLESRKCSRGTNGVFLDPAGTLQILSFLDLKFNRLGSFIPIDSVDTAPLDVCVMRVVYQPFWRVVKASSSLNNR